MPRTKQLPEPTSTEIFATTKTFKENGTEYEIRTEYESLRFKKGLNFLQTVALAESRNREMITFNEARALADDKSNVYFSNKMGLDKWIYLKGKDSRIDDVSLAYILYREGSDGR